LRLVRRGRPVGRGPGVALASTLSLGTLARPLPVWTGRGTAPSDARRDASSGAAGATADGAGATADGAGATADGAGATADGALAAFLVVASLPVALAAVALAAVALATAALAPPAVGPAPMPSARAGAPLRPDLTSRGGAPF
jgi:hypothetical protein